MKVRETPTERSISWRFFVPRSLEVKKTVLWRQFLRYHHRGVLLVRSSVRRYADGLSRRLSELSNPHFFDIDHETELLYDEVGKSLLEILMELPSFFGVEVDETLYVPRVEGMLSMFRNRMRKVCETTLERLWKFWDDIVLEGGNPREVVRRVVGELRGYRGDRIAVTETTASVNFGFHEVIFLEGFRYKQWLSSRGRNVRPSHREADGQVVEIHDTFLVGDVRLRFPSDPSCPKLSEVINCRCFILPYVP